MLIFNLIFSELNITVYFFNKKVKLANTIIKTKLAYHLHKLLQISNNYCGIKILLFIALEQYIMRKALLIVFNKIS